jgi:type VI secretion system secreted protein Hcp
MRMKGVVLACMVVLFTAVSAQAAPEFAVSVTGAIQGKFKGEMLNKGFEDKFAGLGFDYEVTTPRDLSTGQMTQKRRYQPIRIKKAWGSATLQLYAALIKNESLTVTMDFFAPDPKGILVLDHTIKLGNAAVASFKSQTDTIVNPTAPQIDAIEFVFQQIEITDHRGKGAVSDSLLAP